MRQFLSILIVGVLGSPAYAETAGVCTTMDGVQMGPWTDQNDPACGADCDAMAIPTPEESCKNEIGTCIAAPVTPIEDIKFAVRSPSMPYGPMCLEDGPGCQPAPPAGQTDWYWNGLTWIRVQWGASPPERLLFPLALRTRPERLTTLWESSPKGPPPRSPLV